MGYLSEETSEQAGAPVELYFFARGSQYWRYTSASHDFDIGYPFAAPQAGIYQSRAIKRGEIGQSPEPVRAALKLQVQPDLPLLDEFRGIPASGEMTVTVLRLHHGDTGTEVVTLWMGRVLGARFTPDHAELDCEPVTVSLARNGLRRLYSRTCSHALYDSGCAVVPAPAAAAVSSVNRVLIGILPDQIHGDYNGGWLETLDGSQRAMIVSNTSNTLTLLYPLPLEPGQAVRLYKGCDHTTQTCAAKFNNLANFGGFPFIPTKNPFNTGVF